MLSEEEPAEQKNIKIKKLVVLRSLLLYANWSCTMLLSEGQKNFALTQCSFSSFSILSRPVELNFFGVSGASCANKAVEGMFVLIYKKKTGEANGSPSACWTTTKADDIVPPAPCRLGANQICILGRRWPGICQQSGHKNNTKVKERRGISRFLPHGTQSPFHATWRQSE